MTTASDALSERGPEIDRLSVSRKDSTMSLGKLESESPDFLKIDPMETFANDYDRVQELLR